MQSRLGHACSLGCACSLTVAQAAGQDALQLTHKSLSLLSGEMKQGTKPQRLFLQGTPVLISS